MASSPGWVLGFGPLLSTSQNPLVMSEPPDVAPEKYASKVNRLVPGLNVAVIVSTVPPVSLRP
jgi:hypothetical protein